MQSSSKGYIEVFIAGSLWGMMGIFVTHLSLMGSTSAFSSFIRQFVSCIAMFVFVAVKCGTGSLKIDLKQLPVMIFTGFWCAAVFNTAYSESIVNIGAATAAVLMYTAPVFTAIMAAVFYKEKISRIKCLALILNLAGCALTVTGGSLDPEAFNFRGIAFGLLAGICYGSLPILGRFSSGKMHPMAVNFYMFLFGSVFLLPMSKPWTLPAELFRPELLLWGLGLAAFGTFLPYIFYMDALSRPVEVSKVPVIASVETVVASLSGVLILNEGISAVKVIGICIVVLSIAVMNLQRKES